MKRRLSVAFLLLIGTFTYALAANRQVEGVVISSEDNLPLIGASVYVTADDLKKVGNNQSTIGVILLILTGNSPSPFRRELPVFIVVTSAMMCWK